MSSLQSRKRCKLSGDIWTQLDDYQKEAVEFALRVKTAGLFFEQGTGKTWIAGGVIEQLCAMRENVNVLLIVKLTNLETSWTKMLRKCDVRVCRTLEQFKRARGHRVLVLNYEALPSRIKQLRKINWTLIGYDEAQGLKARGTLASRTAAKLSDCEYKLLLTGTPIEKQPQDLWSQFRFLAPHVFGTRWKDFEDYYFEPMSQIDLKRYCYGSMQYIKMVRIMQIMRGRRKFDFNKLNEFKACIAPYVRRVTKDVLGLPPMVYHHEPVTMRGEHKRVYESMRDELVSRLKRGVVSAPLKVTQIGKLQQICGGYVFDDEGEVHEVGRTKQRRLKAIIAREELPIVVFCRYVREVEALRDMIAPMVRRVETLTGSVKKKERRRLQEEFQSGKIEVLICQIKTGGVGIDLFRACVAIIYSCTYSYIDFEQAISRIERRGQTRPMRTFLIYCINAIDEVIYNTILKKRRLVNRVLINLNGDVTWQRHKPPKRRQNRMSRTSSKSQTLRRNLVSRMQVHASRFATTKSRKLARNTAGTTRKSSMMS